MALAALFLSAHAFAAPPSYLTSDDTGTLELSCGMTVQYQVEATYLEKNPMPNAIYRDIYVDWKITYTNPETDKSVTMRESGQETAVSGELSSDGLFVLGYAWNTIAFRTVVPGQKPFINVGKVNTTYVFDAATGELVDVVNEVVGSPRSDDFDTFLCSALAP